MVRIIENSIYLPT